MRVIVLDGNENQAVACVRSIARAGYRVITGADTSWSKAGWSKHSSRSFTYPSPQHDRIAFVQRIAEIAAEEPGTLVLPMTERSMLPLSQHRHLLEQAGARLLLPAHEIVEQACDKRITTETARSIGLAVPQTFTITNRESAACASSDLPYPVVLKPAQSEEITASGVRSTGGPLYARDPRAFLAAYDAIRKRCSAVIVQEFVQGTGVGYFALIQNGEVVSEFAHRRLRDVRPSGSGSSLRVSIPVDAQLRDAGLATLRAMNWQGVAMVEFRQRPDGSLVFLELNPRFWNSLALAVYAGADFPAQLARAAQSTDVQPTPTYTPGVRCRWLVGDLQHLAAVWMGPPPGFPAAFPKRLSTLAALLRPAAGTFHDNFNLRDPLPEIGDWIHFFFRRLPAQMKRQRSSPAAVKA